MRLTLILTYFRIPPMYVCLCNGHAEREIREAAASGLRCPKAVYASLGKPPRCGRCLNVAAEIIESVHENVGAAEPAVLEYS